jgi:CheY-like chemotaxis protein
MVNESSDRLINTIANIMDIALIVSGNQDTSIREIAPGPVLDEIYNNYRQQCSLKKLEFSIAKDTGGGRVVLQTDPELLNKILNHLLDNAIKFTRAGSVKLGYNIKPGLIEFYITDTGIGIKPDEQKRIFELFTQGNASATRNHEGTGLGLSIAKGLADLLGGYIRVESSEGIGSTFSLFLPGGNSEPERALVNDQRRAIQGKPVVLVADDVELNCILVDRMLSREGIEVIMVYDGSQAVEACRNNPSISLVLMDLKMPVMDGFEATRIIRSNHPGLPVIALTAYAMGGDENKAIQAGCSDYLTKPLKRELLLHKLTQYGFTFNSEEGNGHQG